MIAIDSLISIQYAGALGGVWLDLLGDSEVYCICSKGCNHVIYLNQSAN